MSNPLIHDCENYVVLEPGKSERILNADETKQWLTIWLSQLDELPKDLKEQQSLAAATEYLIDTACSLEIKPGFTLQWFAVRLDPPEK